MTETARLPIEALIVKLKSMKIYPPRGCPCEEGIDIGIDRSIAAIIAMGVSPEVEAQVAPVAEGSIPSTPNQQREISVIETEDALVRHFDAEARREFPNATVMPSDNHWRMKAKPIIAALTPYLRTTEPVMSNDSDNIDAISDFLWRYANANSQWFQKGEGLRMMPDPKEAQELVVKLQLSAGKKSNSIDLEIGAQAIAKELDPSYPKKGLCLPVWDAARACAKAWGLKYD